jgi:hypothetical protein
MMANLVIVAIPATDDDVWQVSSEKVPHMTFCFLGPAETNPNINAISDYVKQQAARLAPFSLRVDHRGVLGSDEADVLFFADDIPWQVFDFRESLLADVNIRSAFNSIPQHPGWKPHLTLGYPDTPANKDNWDPMGTQYVSFDKVGVWFSDFGGYSIPLVDNSPKISSFEPTEAAYSALEHHGVKGMRWGVRKSAPTAKVSVAQKGKKLKTTGGHGRKAAPDAVKVAELRQVRKKSGVTALSNEDLQTYAKRLNLEQQVTNLERNQPGVKNWIARTLKGQGNQSVNQAGQAARTKAAKTAIKKVAVTAA